MQTITNLQKVWLAWNGLWGYEMLAMAMALFCSQEAVNAVQWLSQFLSKDSPPSTSTGLEKFKRVLLSSPSWQQQLLLLDYTLEFPFIMVTHPMVTGYSITDALLIPAYPRLAAQILIFLIADRIAYELFKRYFPLFSTDESVPAYRISTDFTIPRTTLLLAIMLIRGLSLLGLNSVVGDLHFVTVAGWMLLRRSHTISYVFKVES